MGYFDKEKESDSKSKIFVVIIISLLVINLLAFKGIMSIAQNKTVVLQVPQFLESGEYVIGNTFANENVYKMWIKVWVTEAGNFSYKDVRKRTEDLFPFLDPQTAFENKSKLQEFADFVEENYITQEFKLDDIKVEKTSTDGYTKVIALGTIHRTIGTKKDELNGFKYSYEFIVFVRNGQIYINSMKSLMTNPAETPVAKKLEANEFVEFNSTIQDGRDRLKAMQDAKKRAVSTKPQEPKE